MAFTCRSLTRILKTKIAFKRCIVKGCQHSEVVKYQRAGLGTNSFDLIKRHNACTSCPVEQVNKNNSNVRLLKSQFHTTYTSKTNPDASLESTNDAQYTHFGYERIKESEKINKVYEVFENVANSYDLMNDAMSMGVHRLWKNKFVDQLNIKPGMKVLDMAGGTGDIAFKILDNFACRYPRMAADRKFPDIIVSDINKPMLDVGKNRAEELGIHESFRWVQANAEELPFEDESFDLYTISFGIRNATHTERLLDEAFRVLKIGGRLSCLEFSTVGNPIINELYEKYSFQVIPIMGQVLASDWQSYKYLVESIRQFPDQEDFAEMFYDSGFSNVRFENLMFGVVAIHDAFKI